MNTYLVLLSVGLIGGGLSALLGIGGAIVIVPALTLILGYTQTLAQGTSLFVLIFPLTLIPALNYYKAGDVNVRSALFIIAGFIISSYFVSRYAVNINPHLLKRLFGVFLLIISIVMIVKQ